MKNETKMLIILGSVASVVGLILFARSMSQPKVNQAPPMPGYLPVQRSEAQLQAQSQNLAIQTQGRLQAAYLLAKYEIAREAQNSQIRKTIANA